MALFPLISNGWETFMGKNDKFHKQHVLRVIRSVGLAFKELIITVLMATLYW